MSTAARVKRVTGAVRDHDGGGDGSLLFHFDDYDCDRNWTVGSDSDDPDPDLDPAPAPVPSAAMIHDLMNPPASDRFRRALIADVTALADRFGSLRPDRAALRRSVVRALRDSGYDAGLCRALPGGGGHEYIDVLRSRPSAARYVVDLDFEAEFEVARPTAEYSGVMTELPAVYVGRAEELRAALRVMAEAVKRSLAARGMHVPPWRKGKYLKAKWLGPHHRTTAVAPQPSGCASFHVAAREAECRAVGFRPATRLLAIS